MRYYELMIDIGFLVDKFLLDPLNNTIEYFS